MKKIITTISAGCAGILLSGTHALAGGYSQIEIQPSPYHSEYKTYTRIVEAEPKHENIIYGDYCLHEPGDTYDLSYGGGCEYDGGYGSYDTVIINNGGYHSGVSVYSGTGIFGTSSSVKVGGFKTRSFGGGFNH